MTQKHPPLAPPLRAVAFDLDGTLVDSVSAITHSVNVTFARLGKAPLSQPQVAQAVGEGARTLWRRLMGDDPRAQEDRWFTDFINHYTHHSPSRTPFFPGAQETLARLRQRVPLALLTNKPRAATHALLLSLGVADWFALVLCPEDVTHRKPHPQSLLRVQQTLNVAPRELLLVGDGRPDAIAAWHGGCPFAACAWGYGGKDFFSPLPVAVTLRSWKAFPFGWVV